MQLATARKRLGLTQEQLAKELGVRTETVNKWENGKLPIGQPKLLRLAMEHLRCKAKK